MEEQRARQLSPCSMSFLDGICSCPLSPHSSVLCRPCRCNLPCGAGLGTIPVVPIPCCISGSGLGPGVPVPWERGWGHMVGGMARGRGTGISACKVRTAGGSWRFLQNLPCPRCVPSQAGAEGHHQPLSPEVLSPLSPSVFPANILPLKFKWCCSPFLAGCRNISLFI